MADKRDGSEDSLKKADIKANDTAIEKKGVRREIPGNLPYSVSHGRLSEALKGLIEAERPQKFNESFMDGVLKIRGGSSRPIPPILKRVGFLSSDNSPTELYSKFKADSSRPDAALQALKTGFSEIFRRNEYAHKLSDDRLRDIIIEITGLTKNDPITSAIFGTFNAFNQFSKGASDSSPDPVSDTKGQKAGREESGTDEPRSSSRQFNLVNTINVVLPETTDVQVYNAIFRSIRENLLE